LCVKKHQPLIEAELVTLQQAQKYSNKDYFRNHCLAIELRLSRNKSVAYIADLLQVKENAVYEWLTRWELMGIVGLMILPGRGVKAPLDLLLKEPTQESIALIKKKLKRTHKSYKK
jgi:transposase